MNTSKLAQSLGISSYPADLDKVSPPLCNPCDQMLLARLEQDFSLLGPYYDIVSQAAQTLPVDSYRWAQIVCTYSRTIPVEVSSRIPMPATDGTPAGDLLPLLILLTLLPDGIQTYRQKGFSETEIRDHLSVFKDSLDILSARYSRPMMDSVYYWWLSLYAKASIFHCGGLQFELRKLSTEATYLENRATGQLVAVMNKCTLHRSGMILGSGGYLDDPGARQITLQEIEDAWIGHEVRGAAVSMEPAVFPKSQWQCALHPGDPILSIHIPVGVCFTPDAIDNAIANARVIANARYPEHPVRGFFCHSWLLNPLLEDILGCDSNIAQFGARFTRCPVRSSGKELFGYVFPHCCSSYQILPETTRLQKAVKALYLNDKFIHAYSGVFL